MEGTVKFFNRIKGFGFINGDDGKDYFVHVSGVIGGKYLNEGDKISFEAVEGDKGLKAEKVELLSAGQGYDKPKTETKARNKKAKDEGYDKDSEEGSSGSEDDSDDEDNEEDEDYKEEKEE